MPDTPQVALVLPTYNEAANLARMIAAVEPHLEKTGAAFEVIVVDDESPDGTGKIADEIAARDSRVRVVHRRGPRGLSLAVVAGWLAARGDILAVMDADLQHPPEVIGRVVSAVLHGADIAVASRYTEGGKIPAWKIHRRLMSTLGTGAVRMALGPTVRRITDPLSGCFAYRRSALRPEDLHPNAGFKILVEVLATGDFKILHEVPYSFAPRTGGESKLSLAVALRDLALVTRLAFRRRNRPPSGR